MKIEFSWKALAALLGLAALVAAAPRIFPVPSNLKPDGIPPLDAALFDEIARYTAARSALLLDWKPGSRSVLIATRFADVAQLHAVRTPGAYRRQLTFFRDHVSTASYNPANGGEILFEKDAGGDEFYQLYLLDASGQVNRITTGDRSRNQSAVWSRSGKQIVYTSTKRDGEHADIWITDPRRPAAARTLYEAKDPGWEISDWSADETKLLLILNRSAVHSELYLMDVKSGRLEPLSMPDAEVDYREARFSADGRGAYVTSNVGSEFERLGYVDFLSKRFTPLRPDVKWDVTQVEVTRDGKKVAYVVNEDGADILRVLDTGTREDIPLPEMPRGTIGGLHWRDMSDEIGFSLTSAQSPGDVYSVRMENGAVERWTYSEAGGLDVSKFSEPRLIHWKSFDGLQISGYLYAPNSGFSGRRPVIINIHGGPEGQSKPGFLGANNYYLQELGVAIIFPNVRGSSGYGKPFLNADNEYKREDSVKDIGALLDWIRTQPDLDASRIMVTGGSYGDYMTLSVMIHYSDRVRCAVEAVGISNFRTFLEHTEAYRRDLRRVEYGDERIPKMRDFFESISPMNNAAKITKPIFIIAGRNDPRVPWTEGKQMTEALRSHNVPTWFLVAEDEGHGFAKKSNRDYLFTATIEFVKRFLLST